MNVYMSDKDQIQMIKDWWNKYGFTVLLSIFIFLVANFSIQYWQKYSTQKKEQASFLYLQMINSSVQNKSDEVKLFAKNLMDSHSSSVYASFAALILAKEAVDKNNLDEALVNLHWVIKNSGNLSLQQLAKSREARILMQQNKYEQTLAVLKASDSKQAFAPIMHETEGDVLLMQNKEKDALKAYNNALNDVYGSKAESPLLKMKIDLIDGD